jgi:hypothetical protein
MSSVCLAIVNPLRKHSHIKNLILMHPEGDLARHNMR